MDPKREKKIGIRMNVMMAVGMSLGLSLFGTWMSGHFTLMGFFISFVASTVVSMVLGFIIPIRRLAVGACRKCGLKERSVKARLMESLVFDLIYTPVMTALMTALAYSNAVKQGAQVTYPAIFLPALPASLVVGYVLILILQPIFLKIAGKAAGPASGR
ncbi:MAG: hypothetical protein K6F35_12420 [Lachnospiraceae bacterium]|nr:hypothetical protein [Lachnospiraceae bacterium]